MNEDYKWGLDKQVHEVLDWPHILSAEGIRQYVEMWVIVDRVQHGVVDDVNRRKTRLDTGLVPALSCRMPFDTQLMVHALTAVTTTDFQMRLQVSSASRTSVLHFHLNFNQGKVSLTGL